MLNLITGLLPVAERVLDKVLPDPEAKAKAILELQKLEQNGELRKIEAEHTNTASAREREVAVVTSNVAPFINKIIVPCLAILIVFLTFGMMSAILFMDIESGKNYEISLYILGLLSGALMSCINYYFGSSTGSKEKSKELQDMFSKKEPKL
jgi:hypothetical protein|tara:strand:- start:1068 stop:1523 length:456 start_codon:yes stop_codon:yes gene_type:complete